MSSNGQPAVTMSSNRPPAVATSSNRVRRVQKELVDIKNDKDNSGVYAEPFDTADVTHLKGTFPAPPDTPYAGGTYQVDIQIPDHYPFKSPIIRFLTKVWHPNISSQTGAICLDTLGSGWSPVGTIKMALISLRMLLEHPNPKDPQDAQVATQMLEDPKLFAKVANDWAVMYAGAPRQDVLVQTLVENSAPPPKQPSDPSRYQGYNKELIDRFVNMGFDLDAVVEAFNFVGIDRNGGEDYELEEAYMGDITARLLGEQ